VLINVFRFLISNRASRRREIKKSCVLIPFLRDRRANKEKFFFTVTIIHLIFALHAFHALQLETNHNNSLTCDDSNSRLLNRGVFVLQFDTLVVRSV
jgi:hypothetical protein